MQISELNQYSLGKFRKLFASLAIPDMHGLGGKYRGLFLGPAWVRLLVKPALLITGLGGWWGKDIQQGGTAVNIVLRKDIHQDGTAVNIVFRKENFSTRFPMILVREKSFIDHKEGTALHYQKGNPFPWMFIVDEIRHIDGSTLLGMTRPNIPGLRWFALPFLLEKQES